MPLSQIIRIIRVRPTPREGPDMRGILADPFGEMSRLRARLRSLLDEAYPPPRAAPPDSRWTPRADVLATDDAITVNLEVCGTDVGDIDVTIHGNVLTVSGLRLRDSTSEEVHFQVERPVGRFSRSFALGCEPRSVQTELADGILTITLRR